MRHGVRKGFELAVGDFELRRAFGHTVLELNGAVDFTREYRIDRDPFVAAAAELTRAAAAGAPATLAEPPEVAATGESGG